MMLRIQALWLVAARLLITNSFKKYTAFIFKGQTVLQLLDH
jgi:hypothetical protein